MALLDIIKGVGQQLGTIPQLFNAQAKARQAEEERKRVESLAKKPAVQQQPVNKTTTIAVAPQKPSFAINTTEEKLQAAQNEASARVVRDLMTIGYPQDKAVAIAVAPSKPAGPDPLLNAISQVANFPNKLAGGIAETAALNLKRPEETFSEYYERLPGLTDIAGQSIAGKAKEVFGKDYGTPLGQAGAFIAALTLDPFNLIPFGTIDDVLKLLAKERNVEKVSTKLKELGVADDLLEGASKAVAEADTVGKVKDVLDRTRILMEKTKISPETQFTTPSIRGGIKEGVQDVVPARPEPTIPPSKISPELSQAPKVSLGTSLSKNIPQTPMEAKAIEKTAIRIKEPVPIVQRVINKAKVASVKVIEYIQNSEERVRILMEKKGLKIDDISDPYLKATLYLGRVADKIEIGKQEVKAIISDMKKVADEFKSDTSAIRKEVNDYLRFRHAPERNAAIGEGAAGITTAEAQAGLKAIEISPRGKKIKELADRASKLNKQTLDLLKNSGVISDELYQTLRVRYKNHVPLQRVFEETEDIGSVLSGRGFDVRSTGVKKAVGSQREVDDILGNIVTNYEQAVLRSEKNIVDQATLAFVRNNKDILGDLFEIVKPKAIGRTFDGKILLERTTDPTILQLYENGKPIWIKINDPHLAIALRGIGREKLGTLLNAVGSFTRLYSGLATRFNPEFAFPNKLRDLQETAVYLASQKGIGFKGVAKTIIRDPKSTKDVLDALRGIDTEGSRLYNEMKSLGGTTGGFGLSTRKQTALDLDKLEKLVNSPTRKIADNLIEYIDDWNTIFEDSTRLSVYKQALDQGLSKERAAFLAKEASINFNRMGKGGPVINAIWMFSNASIQGSAKMIRSLKNPKVLGTTVLAVGGSVAVVNEWNDQIDPEWKNKVSKWDRLNGLPVVLPSKEGEGIKYITIPVSWGIKPIKVMSDYAYDAVSGNKIIVKDMINDTMTAMIEAYNPAGGSDLVSALTPTLLDTPVEIARNRSWTGNKIRPDYDQNAPADIQYFGSLKETKIGETAISISELLNDKADIAISPANMKYAYDQYVGGAGRAVSKTVNTITGLFTGEPVPVDEYPFISRFYRERTQEEVGAGTKGQTEEIKDILEKQSRGRFDIKIQAEALDKELQNSPSEVANARVQTLKTENPALYEKLKEVYQERKLGLIYTEKLMKQLGVENGERAKYIHEKIMELPEGERRAYYEELKTKKVISKEVASQMKKLQQ